MPDFLERKLHSCGITRIHVQLSVVPD